jgi:hypothetical protein
MKNWPRRPSLQAPIELMAVLHRHETRGHVVIGARAADGTLAAMAPRAALGLGVRLLWAAIRAAVLNITRRGPPPGEGEGNDTKKSGAKRPTLTRVK